MPNPKHELVSLKLRGGEKINKQTKQTLLAIASAISANNSFKECI